ncbi:hypothetical protein AB0K48_07475 [Nonomuraea sp. NPDC055795]
MERSLGEVEPADRAAELLADGREVVQRNAQRIEELGAAFDQVFRDGQQPVDSDLKGLGQVTPVGRAEELGLDLVGFPRELPVSKRHGLPLPSWRSATR